MLQVEKYKTGIKIKKSNRGKFTSYCGGQVTSACILRGKNSPNPAIRKRATFAANARKWKHLFGGTLKPSKEETDYMNWRKLPASQLNKYRINRAKAYLKSGPNITNLYNAFKAILGGYDPKNPRLLTGEPTVIPGYLIKPLMQGNLLVGLLSKAGTVSTNAIKALANKSGKFEGTLMLRVVDTKFPNLSAVDYDKYRRAILSELIPYSTRPTTEYADYGLDRLGFSVGLDLKNIRFNPKKGAFEGMPVKADTYTFESPRLPLGNDTHYASTTLGHSRTFTNPEEPQVLNIMESQSDWALHPHNVERYSKQAEKAPHRIDILKESINRLKYSMSRPRPAHEKRAILELIDNNSNRLVLQLQYLDVPGIHVRHLQDSYIPRQILENMLYAQLHGYTSMRYPTRSTAIKVEGYKPTLLFGDNMNKLKKVAELRDKITLLEHQLHNERSPHMYRAVANELEDLKQQYKLLEQQSTGSFYSPLEETILKKYDLFPNIFGKLFRDVPVSLTSDVMGNSWYEVNIPKDLQMRELLYKKGGKLNG